MSFSITSSFDLFASRNFFVYLVNDLKCDKIVQEIVTLKGSKQQGEFERQQSCGTQEF